MLLQKADGMFSEGTGGLAGGPRAFAKDGSAAEKTNELLENATSAIEQLFKQRGYDPKKPAEVKAKLGYALDRYEAAAYLVTGAMHLPLISQPEAWTIGKRINNIIGASGTVGAKLKALRKRGKAAAPVWFRAARAKAVGVASGRPGFLRPRVQVWRPSCRPRRGGCCLWGRLGSSEMRPVGRETAYLPIMAIFRDLARLHARYGHVPWSVRAPRVL